MLFAPPSDVSWASPKILRFAFSTAESPAVPALVDVELSFPLDPPWIGSGMIVLAVPTGVESALFFTNSNKAFSFSFSSAAFSSAGIHFLSKLTIGLPLLSETAVGVGSFSLLSLSDLVVAFRSSSLRISFPSFMWRSGIFLSGDGVRGLGGSFAV